MSSPGPAWKGQEMVFQTKAADSSTDRQQDKVHKKWFKEEPNKDVGLQEKKKTTTESIFVKSEKGPSTLILHFYSYSVAEHRTTHDAIWPLEMLQKEHLISLWIPMQI